MARASGGRTSARLTPVHVPEALSNGNKFIKWDDDSSIGVPVTLWVDPKGYILYWKDQNNEMDFLDISLIRDTRTGRYAHLPKDSRLRETINMGMKDCPLEKKIITVCYGVDLVNISFVNFAAVSKEIAREWTDVIFRCATNLLVLNGNVIQFLEKCYTKLTLVRDNEGKIPVRNIIRMFAQSKDDRKRIQVALELAHLPSSFSDKLSLLMFDDFLCFYRHLCGRQEVDEIFSQLLRGKNQQQQQYLTAEQFMRFLNDEQRDSRLNEILYPFCDLKKAKALIEQYEYDPQMVQDGHLSREGFLRYLMSHDNMIIPTEKLELCLDMTQPLSHYFINSSHNTYLTGHQLTGKSSVEIYRQVLLTGCRCVELDCWDGRGADEEPIITHGFTMCTEVLFKEVIEAIFESAFKTSDYPVILSFENHCSAKQQAKMAFYCRSVFGDSLLMDQLDSHKLEPNIPLPSPEVLKRKILVKNKKRHMHSRHLKSKPQPKDAASTPIQIPTALQRQSLPPVPPSPGCGVATVDTRGKSDEYETEPRSPGKDVGYDDDDDEDTETDSEAASEKEEESKVTEEGVNKMQVAEEEKGTSEQEVQAGMELSALVNYIQPVRFHTFDYAEKRQRSYECTSFVETQSTALLKSFPVDFVNFNKRQLSRIYPKGTRVDSSNYMPQIFWNAGCQLVALNFQTLDLSMQLNLGIFESNERCGYVLKPDFMRRKDRQFDPFAESTVDGIVAGTMEVKIISGQFLTDRKVGTYVEVDMYGLPADTVRRKFRTRVCPSNGINPVYNEEPFVFPKVILPNLAILRIAVYQDNGTTLLGHRILPIESLRPGYRHICLRNESNQPQGLATLFVRITVKDFVHHEFADLAAALCNPIAYQSSLERHSLQLAVLEMDSEVESCEASPVARSAFFLDELRFDKKRSESIDSSNTANADVWSNSSSSFSEPTVSYSEVTNNNPVSPHRSLSLGNTPPALSTNAIEREIVLRSVNLEDFKRSKQYEKLASRFIKEMSSLQLKNEKIRANKLHQQQMEMLRATSEFRSIKSGKNSAFYSVDENVSEDANQIQDVKRRHMDEALPLFQQLHRSELDLWLTYQMQLSTRLYQMVAAERDTQLGQLDKVHSQNVAKQKKKHDEQNWEEMKTLVKKHKDKNELARVQREARQKNIKFAVQDRQKLKENHEESICKVHAKYNQLFEQIKQERMQMESKLRLSFEEKCASDAARFRLTVHNGSGKSAVVEEEEEEKDQTVNQVLSRLSVSETVYMSTRL